MNIEPGTVWQYVGPDGTAGVRHQVTGVAGNEVSTWSEPVDRFGCEIAGFSWHGPASEFLKQFKRV